jgi:ubiquinone/menaquinone biosynthesis C-methylase UbiE
MSEEQLYNNFARYYDKIYNGVDYEGEVEFIKWAVKEHKTSSSNLLMDVACGTGTHAQKLIDSFNITGVDISPQMLEIAGAKVPDANFIQGNMKNLNIGSKFDVITCIFSAIHYNRNLKELEHTLQNFYDHLIPGGIVIFDLSLNKNNWIEGLVSVDTVVEEDLKIARICQSKMNDGLFNANFVFLVKDQGEFDFDIDQHELGVFEVEEVINLMEETKFETFVYAGFTAEEWTNNSVERPIFVGIKNLRGANL